MFKYTNAFTNRSGDSLPGYFARLFDAGGNLVSIYADASETPISTVSGVANAALSDENGMFRWYVANGTYDIRFYDANDVFVSVETAYPMYEASGVYTDLSADGGAALIGSDGGDTVQEALDTLTGSLNGKVDLNGTQNVRIVMDETNTEEHVLRIDSVADGGQVDGIFVSSVMQNSGSGYPVHGIMEADASIGADAAGGGGFAADGPGNASGAVGNRQGVGPGNGLQGARLGSGVGAGVEARASSTGECYAVRGIKQNPVAGTAGTGPAIWAINDSTNGQALYARSASANTDSNTAVIERLNGTVGTGLFTRITGAGPRTGVLIGGSTQITPSATSTGAFAVYGHDVQISANISGAETRGISLANSAVGTGESYGMTILVDGARTTSYGLFVNVANAGTNYGVYVQAGLSYFGGNVNAASEYQVGGTKVIGAQGAAVADATDAASAITQLNALLARCRAHGLIAT